MQGLEGFKNVKKSTSIAAQAAGTALGNVSVAVAAVVVTGRCP